MGKRLLTAGLAALCALAISAVTTANASATATAYTVGSPTAVAAGTSTGIALDATSDWVLSTSEFGASFVVRAVFIDCENCMGENQASPMDVTGSSGRLLFTNVTTNLHECVVEASGKGAGTVTTEPLKFTAGNASSVAVSPVNGVTFATIHLGGPECKLPGNYSVEGASVSAALSGDTLEVNSSGELEVLGEAATLTGTATMTAGVTGGTYHPIEFKTS